jgi:hypothetical protein
MMEPLEARCLLAGEGEMVEKLGTRIEIDIPRAWPPQVAASVTSFEGSPSGTVTFKDGESILGSATLVDGKTSLAVPTWTFGQHQITAHYDGDDKFLESESSYSLKSNGAVQLTLSASRAATVAGQPVELIAEVSYLSDFEEFGFVAFFEPSATGEVVFVNPETGAPVRGQILGASFLDGSRKARLAVSSLAIGMHSITAVYVGQSVPLQVLDRDISLPMLTPDTRAMGRDVDGMFKPGPKMELIPHDGQLVVSGVSNGMISGNREAWRLSGRVPLLVYPGAQPFYITRSSDEMWMGRVDWEEADLQRLDAPISFADGELFSLHFAGGDCLF